MRISITIPVVVAVAATALVANAATSASAAGAERPWRCTRKDGSSWRCARGLSARLGHKSRLRRSLRLKEFPVPGHDEVEEGNGLDHDEAEAGGEDSRMTHEETAAADGREGPAAGESFIKSIFSTVCETVEAVCVVLPPKSKLAASSSSAAAAPAPVPQASFK